MPYSFEFDAKNKVLLGKLGGHVTEHEFEEFYNCVPIYSATTNPLCAIADFSGVTRFDVRKEKIRSFAYAQPTLRDPKRPRVVVAPEPALYGLARMFQALGEETRPMLTIVRKMEEAYKELHIQLPRFEPLGPIVTE